MPKSASSFFPIRDLWLPALPFLPMIALSVLLSTLIEPAEVLEFLQESELELVSVEIREWIHLADMLVYYSMISIHALICLSVIFYFLFMMRKLPAHERLKTKVFVAIFLSFLGILVIYYVLNASDVVLIQLGFKAVCIVIMNADLPTNLATGLNLETGDVEPTCFRVLYNKLTFLTVFQVCSGMVTAAFAAAFAYGNASAFPPSDDPQWRSVAQQRIKALQRSVYALSAVLVSSTLTISLFENLPTGLLSDESGHASAVSTFAVGVTTFWGALFSLTLVATFAAPSYRIVRQVYAYRSAGNGTEASPSDLRDWLHEHVFVSVKNQLVNFLSLLAPLLVGPVSSLLSGLA